MTLPGKPRVTPQQGAVLVELYGQGSEAVVRGPRIAAARRLAAMGYVTEGEAARPGRGFRLTSSGVAARILLYPSCGDSQK